jgi:hypothetical protein
MNHFFFLITIIFSAFFSQVAIGQQTAKIHGKQYEAIWNQEQRMITVVRESKDTILNILSDNFVGVEFRDFNKDGHKDIFLEWGGNMPDRYSLYLFIPSSGRFKEIENFSEFPAAKTLTGTKYYYSYYKAGCADHAWGSHLFYIKNFKIITIGNIKGDGCGIDDGINIYKVKNAKKTLLRTLPLDTIDKYKDYKWGFIKQYWTTNYKKFV